MKRRLLYIVHAGIINTGDVVVNGCEESRVPVRSFLPAGWDHPVLLFSVQVQNEELLFAT